MNKTQTRQGPRATIGRSKVGWGAVSSRVPIQPCVTLSVAAAQAAVCGARATLSSCTNTLSKQTCKPCADFEKHFFTYFWTLSIRLWRISVDWLVHDMDLSCGENMQHSGNSGSGRMVDMCVAGPDRALDRDPRLLLNLLALERSHAIHTDYFQTVQIDIQPFMRKVVTTWMLEVST